MLDFVSFPAPRPRPGHQGASRLLGLPLAGTVSQASFALVTESAEQCWAGAPWWGHAWCLPRGYPGAVGLDFIFWSSCGFTVQRPGISQRRGAVSATYRESLLSSWPVTLVLTRSCGRGTAVPVTGRSPALPHAVDSLETVFKTFTRKPKSLSKGKAMWRPRAPSRWFPGAPVHRPVVPRPRNALRLQPTSPTPHGSARARSAASLSPPAARPLGFGGPIRPSAPLRNLPGIRSFSKGPRWHMALTYPPSLRTGPRRS